MTHRAPDPRHPFAALAARAAAWAVAGGFAFGAALVGATAPAAAQTFEITNTAEVRFQLGDGPTRRVLAENRLTVQAPPPVTGNLRILQLPCINYCAGGMDLPFAGAEYAPSATPEGPFAPLPALINRTDMHGNGGAVDTAQAVRVVESGALPPGAPLFIVLDSPMLNRHADRAETALVEVRDAVSGDVEVIRAVETGPDTGIFTAALGTETPPAVPGNGVLTTIANSAITATVIDPYHADNRLSATLPVGPIDPNGVVFDEFSGQPLDGVRITLIDADTGAPAIVLGDDLRAAFPATVTTGSTVTDEAGRVYAFGPGEFRFPLVMPGRYRLQVVPPPGFDIPARAHELSARRFKPADMGDGIVGADLSASGASSGNGNGNGRWQVIDASYGDVFAVLPGQPLQINVPLVALVAATITRSADVTRATQGDFVTYTVSVGAPAAATLSLTDRLGPGLRLVPGSLRVNGAPAVPALSTDGATISLPGLATGPGAGVTVRYTVQVTAAARPGQVQRSLSELRSGAALVTSAAHDLPVGDAFGLQQLAVLGAVVSGPCGAPEAPGTRDLSGIRILTETGGWAETDAEGRFTFPDLPRRTTVLQLDTLSLPRNARAVLCTNTTRRAGSAISQFVEAAPGLMARATFNIVFDRDEAATQPTQPSAWQMPAVPRPEAVYTQAWLDAQPAGAAPRLLFPSDDAMPHTGMVDVFYLRDAGHVGEVMVNGRTVRSDRREPAMTGAANGLALDRWRAVRLEVGRTTITVILRDATGVEVFRASRTLWQATDPAFLSVLEDSSVLESDGRSRPVIEARVTDRNGVPLRPGMSVAVRILDPHAFDAPAPRPGQPANERARPTTTTATVGADGIIRLVLAPMRESGWVTLEILGRHGAVTTRVRISAADRPWVLVGLAEGTLAPGRIRRSGIPGDADIRDPASGRVAFFAEGMVRGDWLLTLRYDSDAGRFDGFHGIDPDRDYIVYGDASRTGQEAQGRFPLYVRLRRDEAEVLLGDFDTAINTGLIAVNRRTTGLRAAWDGEDTQVIAFVARPDDRHVQERIPADGTTGPFRLGSAGIVAHSEVVRVTVVSRLDASEVLETRVLVAGIDYTIDRERAELRLRRPLPAFTAELNRNVLIVGYLVDSPARAGRIAGVRASHEVAPGLRAGLTALDARRVGGTDGNARLLGVDVTWQASDVLTLSAEAVEATKHLGLARHRGRMVELRLAYDDGAARFAAYARRQRGDVTLSANSATVDADVAGLDFAVNLDAAIWGQRDRDTGLFVEGAALVERDHQAGSRRADARALLIHRNEAGVTRGAGLRVIRRDDATGRSEAARLLTEASWTTTDGRLSLTIGTETTLMQRGAVLPGDHLTVEAGYQLTDAARGLLALSAAPGRGQGSMASLGLVTSPWGDARLTASLIRAARGGAAGFSVFLGLEQDIALSEVTRLSLGMDAQRDLGAADVPVGVAMGQPFVAESFVALRAGISRQTEGWGARAAIEARFSEAERKLNLRVSGDGMLADGWTVGVAGFAGRVERTGAPARHDLELRASAAHRTGAEDPLTLVQAELVASADAGSDRQHAMVSAYHHRHLSAVDTLNARLAVKAVAVRGETGRHRDVLGFAGVEYRRDLTDKVDVGVHGGLMRSAGQGGTQASLGLSAGFTPFANGWVSVGYNVIGFRDVEFSQQGHTDRGAFMQVRMKFDQTSVQEWMR